MDYAAGVVAVKQSSQPLPADEDMDLLTLAMFRSVAEELRT
jgi:hypothetical protein